MVPSGGAPIHNGPHGRQELVKNTRTILPSFTWIETASPDWSTPWIRTACCPVRGIAVSHGPRRRVSRRPAAQHGPQLPGQAHRPTLPTVPRRPSGRPTGPRRASLPSVRIGVIGATGPAGQAVAAQLAGIGFEVVVGSRAIERATEAVSTLKERWPGRSLELVPGENQEAACADLVIVATPWDGVLSTIAALRDALAGKIVISMANALTRWGRDMVPLIPPTGSVTVAVAGALPGSRVVGAFHHLPAGPWSDLGHVLEADVLVCSDDRHATDEVIAPHRPPSRPARRRRRRPRLRPGDRGPDPGPAGSQPALQDPRRHPGHRAPGSGPELIGPMRLYDTARRGWCPSSRGPQ